MQVVKSVSEFRKLRKELGAGTLAFVPTMGALHRGHVKLMTEAKKHADFVAVSIFVNPTQFGPNEDFAKYPRTEAADLAACEEAGVDLVFMPTVAEIYGTPPSITLKVGKIADVLCGAHRPGHFDGVVQVVAILFNIVQPEVALFGEKDFQQLAIIRKLVIDLKFPIEIIGVPTVREPDGLALSSRNRYLSPEDRSVAPVIYKALAFAKKRAGEARFDRIALPAETVEHEAMAMIQKEIPHAAIDYFEIRHAETLEKNQFIMNKSRAFAAVRVGTTRLIDNLSLGEE